MIYLTGLVVFIAMGSSILMLCTTMSYSLETWQRIGHLIYLFACAAVVAWLVYILQTFSAGGIQ